MDESRLIALGRAVASGVVSEKPCFVYSICGIGIADATNVYTIHDGHSTTGKAIMRLVSVAYSADFRLFATPLFFAHGIYVDFTTNGSEVTLQYLELAR